MSELSPKNQLQEFCQKRNLPLPLYTVTRLGGQDHKPLFQATVVFNGTQLTGPIASNKGQATLRVAEEALKIVHKAQVPRMSCPERRALFVDVENLPLFIEMVLDRISNLIIYAFVGAHHVLASKHWDQTIKILVQSTRVDGTDTAMQVYVGYYLSQNIYDYYYIATRDHYGANLVEMITVQPGPWESKAGYLVTQVDHILETF